jgi:hypothetical protein
MDASLAQDPLEKLEIAKQKKEAGDQAFKAGEITPGQLKGAWCGDHARFILLTLYVQHN